MEARGQDGVVDTNCSHRSAPLMVPRIPPNPYLRPIKDIAPDEVGTISLPLRPAGDPIRRVGLRTDTLCRSLHNNWSGHAGCRGFSRAHPRYSKTFTSRIGGGAQRAGHEHWNLLNPIRAFLANPNAIFPYRIALEFQSLGRTGYDRCSSFNHLRAHPLFTLPDQISALLLGNTTIPALDPNGHFAGHSSLR